MSEQGREAKESGFEEGLRRATQLLTTGQLGAAQQAAAEALGQRPANVLAQNLLGLVLFQQGRFERALEIFDSLVRRNADVVTLRLNAGHAALGAGNLQRALEHFQRGVELDPGHGRAFGYLGLVHLRRREQHLARAALEEAGLQDLADALGGPELEESSAARIADEIAQRSPGLLPPLEAGPAPHEGFAEVQLQLAREPEVAPAEAEPSQPVAAAPELEPEALDPDDLEAAFDAVSGGGGPDEAAAPQAAPVELDAELPEEEAAPPAEPEASWEAALPETEGGSLTSPEPAGSEETSAPWSELQTVQVMVDAASSTARARRSGLSHSKPQGRATERLAGLALPGLYEGPAAVLRAGLLVLRLGAGADEEGPMPPPVALGGAAEGALVRSDLVQVCRGRLTLRTAHRVRKGAEQDPFLCEGVPFLCAEGEGALVLHPGPGLEVELLHLDEEALYLRETALCACSATLRWENGRIPGAGPDGPGIVQVHGTGFVALRRSGRLHTVAVLESEALSVRLDRLVGWTGQAVPQQIQRSGEIRTVGFTGEGMLLVSLVS